MECEKMRTFDYTKLKERKWDSEILGLVAQIHEFKGRQELYLKQGPFKQLSMSEMLNLTD